MTTSYVVVKDDLGSLAFPHFNNKEWQTIKTDYGYLVTDGEENEIYVAKTYGQNGQCAWVIVWTQPDLTQDIKSGRCASDNASVQKALDEAFAEMDGY